MTDTERLSLIEHYKWEIVFDNAYAPAIVIRGSFGIVFANTLREAIHDALTAQINWSLGK